LDIKRDPPKKTKQYVLWSVGLLGIVAVSVGISRLKPAAPTVERGTLWFGVAQKGEMVRKVSAPGTLVPMDIQIVSALAGGRIEALPVRPGETVTATTTIIELSNPDVQLTLLQFKQNLSQAYGTLAQTKTSWRSQLLSQESLINQLQNSYNVAVRDAAVTDSLDKKRLAMANEVSQKREAMTELKRRLEIERSRMEDMKTSEEQQIRINEDQIASLKLIIAEQEKKLASLRVVAGRTGQLQTLGNPQLEIGQYVQSGLELARVVQPGRLKAVLRVPETQAKDVGVGQVCIVDLNNNNTVKGHVIRTDPSSVQGTVTVEVALDGALPPGTRSDLAVNGEIEIDRIAMTMFIPRPGFGQAESSVGIFKVNPNQGDATRATIQLGRASVNTIEVKNGLSVGDSVIISDMSAFDAVQRVRIK